MQQQTKAVLLLCILFPVLIVNCKSKPAQQVSSGVPSSVTSDKVKLTGLNGRPVDLSDYKGKTVFINFWATWCKPCVQEMPSLQRLTEKLKDKNIVFLFASDESSEEISGFKTSREFPMEFVRVESLMDLHIVGLPTTFIFDKNGTLTFSEMGSKEWDTDESIAEINKIINQ